MTLSKEDFTRDQLLADQSAIILQQTVEITTLKVELDAARGVIREYRERHKFWPNDCHNYPLDDLRCSHCIKADSLLTKPEGTR